MMRRNSLAFAGALFLLLPAAGCKAQTTKASDALSNEILHRIQAEVRSRYNVPEQINISISDLRPSDLPGYDQITVHFTGGTHSSTFEFLISKDRKTLAHLEKIDISQDLMSKIDVKGRPVRGNEQAKVVIVNYQDFECPFCFRLHSALFPDLMKEYSSKVKIIYKDYPLVEIHPWALHAAVDANCLASQSPDAFWDFADYVFANQKQVGGQGPAEAFANLDKAALEQTIKHKLDVQKIVACTQKQDESAIRESMAEGDKLGVDSTPTMFINGERISGAVPAEKLRSILDRIFAEQK
ncbi:MAG TPA: thioredoxin domain-containing protein [Candidatus Acidoferrales bacterium]|nr:thioredoxin domain-containing protein [Candidatus Acidoferrales bacterium]